MKHLSQVKKRPRKAMPRSMLRQAGLTIIELLIGIAVLAVTFSLYKGGPYLIGWWTAQGEANQMYTALACQTSLTNSSTFSGMTLATVVNNNCLADAEVSSFGTTSATAKNKVGSTYAIASITYGGTANGALQIGSPGINNKSCSPLVAKLDTLGVQQIVVGTTTLKDVSAGTSLSDSAVATACSASTTVTVYAARTKPGN